MEGYLPIAGWPGYMVHPDGRVRSRYGDIEANDKGRFTLRNKETRKKKTFTWDELIKMAAADPVPVEVSKTETASKNGDELESLRKDLAEAQAGWERSLDEISELKKSLLASDRASRYQRRLNAALWARLRRFERELAEPKLDNKTKRKMLADEEAEWSEMLPLESDFQNLES